MFLIAFLLFTLLPIMTSFVQPIIRNRYWQIGAAAFPVLMLFAARVVDSWRNRGAVGNRLAVGSTALCLLVASSVLGIANAKYYSQEVVLERSRFSAPPSRSLPGRFGTRVL